MHAAVPTLTSMGRQQPVIPTVDLADINTSNAADVPYYFPVGCDEISPFPTYFPGTEDCDPSNEFCNPGLGILVGSSAALLPPWMRPPWNAEAPIWAAGCRACPRRSARRTRPSSHRCCTTRKAPRSSAASPASSSLTFDDSGSGL
mgnify:CR=1 FL=1